MNFFPGLEVMTWHGLIIKILLKHLLTQKNAVRELLSDMSKRGL